jgi:hypothetical protein
LSDISLYANYMAGGWRPEGYYLFNIFLHGVNSYLLFLFCYRWRWAVDVKDQRIYAWFAAILFLVYPFHSEGIDWILGRGASLCTFFGLAALVTLLGRLRTWQKLSLAGCLYFVGMAAYEPVVLLPVYILIVLFANHAKAKEMRWWGLVSGVVFVLHLAVRYRLAGGFNGDYVRATVDFEPGVIAGNLVKVAVRLFLPPSDHTRLMAGLSLLLLLGLIRIGWAFYRRTRNGPKERTYFFALVVLMALSCIFPTLTAVSTRTSESDRMLYLPSVFFCSGMSFLLVLLVGNASRRFWIFGLALVYMIFFLEKTNLNWLKASGDTSGILEAVARGQRGSKEGKIYIVNLPDERDGAYIFRLGFPEALSSMGLDVSRVVVVNHLKRDQERVTSRPIRPEKEGEGLVIPPFVRLRNGTGTVVLTGGDSSWRAGAADEIFYWDGGRLNRLSFP